MASSSSSAPAGVDLSEDKRPVIIAVSVTTWVLAFLTLMMRVVGRRIKGLNLWLDDWFIVAALIAALGHVIGMAGYATSRGVGQHVWAGKPDATYAWALGLFMAEIFYTLTLWLTKLSILAFYWRSFGVWRSMRWPIWALAAIVSSWGIALLLVTILQCSPTRAAWARYDPDNPLPASEYHCRIDQMQFFYGNAVPTIVTDVMLMLLPLPYVWRLHLPAGGKLALSGIFLVGIFVTVVSVIRLVLLLRTDLVNPDITWNFVSVGVLTIVEGNIAVVCACLPFAKPVLKKISFGLLDLTPLSRSRRKDNTGTTGQEGRSQFSGTWGLENYGTSHAHARGAKEADESDEHPFARLQDDGSDRSIGTGNQSTSIKLQDMSNEPTMPRGILVTKDVRQQHLKV
ncbi:hypothetical protein B0T10DRAFT_407061 [Thelonectria olida]|uniref:Rhodopsin domain-containing protein n=1 Tax=Thelonectria olida TaxID=1576542 RepID=A0A9P8W1X5_9HYPO|nr:hypothetical protein B0T10DRAFT_407061 [Thelonectria olida]